MVKVGTYILSDDSLGMEERILQIKESGFDFLALGLGLFSGDELEPTVELCRKHGMPIDNIHLTGAKTTAMWSEDELGDRVCERYCREIRRASAAGVKTGVAHITWGHTPPAPASETAFARFVKIAECAQENGFTLALENSVYIEYLYETMARLKDFKSIGYTYDSGHHNAFAPERELLHDFGDRLAVTHIQDNNGIHDLHMPAFDGNVDWEKVARELAKTETGRDRICAEVSAGAFKELKGMTEQEARANIAALPIAATPELLTFEGNKVAVGASLTYKEKLDRLYGKMKKLAAMIENEISLSSGK
ncbi:MAG: sugar phosphate isomerase/epimerase family protein [Eubacteriales bacterium]